MPASDNLVSLYGWNAYSEGPLVAGPLLGEVTPSGARIWVQARSTAPLTLRIVSASDRREQVAVPAAEDWLCTLFDVDDLHPDVEYEYAFSSEHGETASFPLRRGLAPEASRARIVFGSCYKQYRQPLPIFDAIARESADLFLLLGDTCYTDEEDRVSEATHMQAHLRNRNQDNLRALVARVPTLAIWDDHDFGPNDSDGTYSASERAYRCWRRMWAQRQYGTASTRGIFSRVRCGPIELFFLDSRLHRAERRHILGDAQLRWLLDGLVESTAAIKLILSGSQLLPEVAMLPSWDWECFRRDGAQELEAIVSCIASQGITGVVALSGDPHLGQILRQPGQPLPGGRQAPALWELTSSPIANKPWQRPVWPADSHGEYAFDRFLIEEVAARNYGVVDVVLDRAGAELRLSLCAEDGTRFFTYDLALAALAPQPQRRRLCAAAFDDRHAYAWAGRDYARYDLRSGRPDSGYPRPIRDGWKGIPGEVDAVLLGKNRHAYFFHGNGYTRYDLEKDRADADYPKYIKTHWHGVWAADLDAVVPAEPGFAYFIKGRDCIRYDLEADRAEPGYPKPLDQEFPGLFPDGVDAAIGWPGGLVYFVKGDQVLRYELPARALSAGYPRPLGTGWFGFLSE